MEITKYKIIDYSWGIINPIDHQPPLTVCGAWAGGAPHNPRARDHGAGVIRLQLPLMS